MATDLTALFSLRLWHATALSMARAGEPDLSFRQMSILLEVYLQPAPHTVRDLAARLSVTKPVITRALDRLGRLGLLKRVRDPDDRRSVLIKRTVEGVLFVERFGDLIVSNAAELPR